MVSLPVPHSECLMLSLMSVAGQWAWTHCHGACKDRAATSSCPLLPQMPTEAFNLPLSSQHRHFSDFKRAWSAQEVQFPSLQSLAEATQYFLLEHAAWNLFYRGEEGVPNLTSTCNAALFHSLLPVAPTSQSNLPSPSSPLTCQTWLGNSGTEWLKLFHEWK